LYDEYVPSLNDKLVIHVIDQLDRDEAVVSVGDRRVREDTDNVSHIEDPCVIIERDGQRIDPLTCRDEHRFKYMMCSAGFVVLSNGDVLKCWKDLGKRVLTNAFNKKAKKLPVWDLCRYDECSCDERFTKLSIERFIERTSDV
jgi:hypothetical protein